MNNPNNLITTIIPTYNRSSLLKKTIRNVLSQNNSSNIIISDNASTDNTPEVVKKFSQLYKGRFCYFKNLSNIGIYNNFNSGLKRVKSKYFNIMSDDDFLAPGFINECIQILENNSDINVVVFDTIVINKNYKVVADRHPKYFEGIMNAGQSVEKFVKNEIPRTWTGMMFRSNVLTNSGYIDNDIGPYADGYWLYKVFINNKIFLKNKVGAILVNHDKNFSNSIKTFDLNCINHHKIFKKRLYSKLSPSNKLIMDQTLDLMLPNFFSLAKIQIMNLHYEKNINDIDSLIYFFYKNNFKHHYLEIKKIDSTIKKFPIIVHFIKILKIINRSKNFIITFFITFKFKKLILDIKNTYE